MKKILSLLAASATLAGGAYAVTQPAHAAGSTVTATYGCSTVTFHNPYPSSVTVYYGRSGTGDEAPAGASGQVRIGQGGSITVKVPTDARKSFSWRVGLIGTKEINEKPTSGSADLTRYCGTSKEASPASGDDKAAPTPKAGRSQTGGLSRTGV